MELFEWTLALLLAATALTALSRRIGAPYPALLALAGAGLAFLPLGRTPPAIDPHLALALFVAPVLLDAAYDTSPRELKSVAVPLLSLAGIAVLLTTAAVTVVGTRWGGLPLAAAVALGAIVAPPDAAAASAVLSQLKPPERVLSILKGESLLNDATALLIFRMAVVEATAGVSLAHETPWLVLGAVASPVAGWLLARAVMFASARIEDAPSSVVVQFVSTFGVWLLADRAGLSAILTTVVYAMTVARIAPKRTQPRLRVASYSVWETAVFVLNVLAFTLMGLQARPILERLHGPERDRALVLAGLVLATVVVVRLIYVLGWVAAVRVAPGAAAEDGDRRGSGEGAPTRAGVRSGLLVSWCGMRGLVTLAAAFALPRDFPGRDTIVLCAFGVVLGTLVLQGFTLPLLLRWLGLHPDGVVEREVSRGRSLTLDAALGSLAGRDGTVAEALRRELRAARRVAADPQAPQAATEYDALRLQLLTVQRERLNHLRAEGAIGDEAFHRLVEELDWHELASAPAGRFQPLTT